jgi:hypothetical protein
MMKKYSMLSIGTGLLLATVVAGQPAAQSRRADASGVSLDARTTPAAIAGEANVDYLNGGIGKEQADRMREMSSRYPVQMTFSQHDASTRTDEFVADVHLRVIDRAGRTVVDLPAQGPIFLLRLPDGAYTVEAEYGGAVKSRRFDVVAGRHDTLAFSWS